jgi:hypothetical protein
VGDQALNSTETAATGALLRLTVESWRFSRLFGRLLQRIDVSEQQRYNNQFTYYLKSLEETLASAGLRLVNLEGQPYDPGMPVSAVNAGDFGADDALIVEQMLEPVIMASEGLAKSGVVILGKIPK